MRWRTGGGVPSLGATSSEPLYEVLLEPLLGPGVPGSELPCHPPPTPQPAGELCLTKVATLYPGLPLLPR